MWAKMFAPLLYQINAMCSSGFFLRTVFNGVTIDVRLQKVF